MNQDERDIFGKTLTAVAFLYGHEFPKERASMFITALCDFIPATLDEYLKALRRYTEDSKNRNFPNPSQLRPYLRPELSIEAKANEAAYRIRSAITKFGWAQPIEAKEYMGDLGWTIVERSGGWQHLCQNHGVDIDPLIFHAQARESAKAIIESAALGQFDRPISIDSSETRKNGLLKGGDIAQALIERAKSTRLDEPI